VAERPRTELFGEWAEGVVRDLPLYRRLCHGAAGDAEVADRVLLSPDPAQRIPNLLLAAVHDVVLAGDHHPDAVALGHWYASVTDPPRPVGRGVEDPWPHFRALALHHDGVAERLRTRTTQTNEVGRCGSLLPALGLLAQDVGPLGLLDVGASGGLNLLLDRYEYRYRSADGATTRVGGPSTVRIDVDTTGAVAVPAAMPTIVARSGIDQRPIDVTDAEEATWLEACVWPDQADRFHRLVAAIGIAQQFPPDLVEGDAVTSLAAGIARVGTSAHPVVTNSWVLNYLTSAQRVAYLAELERIGAERDLSWVYAEAPARIPELPNAPDQRDDDLTVLSMVRWRGGERIVDHLATVHPHGFWMHWR
jgi:hypothetical protein